MKDVGRIIAFVLILISISALYSFVSNLSFTNTGLPGIVGTGGYHGKTTPIHTVPASFSQAGMTNLSEMSNPAKVPIYFVEGLNDYTYLMRLYTSAVYDEKTHSWIEEKTPAGEMKAPRYYTVRYKVTPIVEFKKHIPVSDKTVFVTLKAVYYPETSTFYIKSDKKPYVGYSLASPPRATFAAKLPENSPYLQVTCPGKDRIRALALKVTKGAKNDYEKAEKIAEFLETNYSYGFTTYSGDPIYDFLFVKKVGVCKQFASAFVMMCRSIGIPARMVFGYMARPEPYNQTVFSSQAHAWAEVLFKTGWVEFNPTPSQKKIPTECKITKISKKIYAGENLTLSGVVLSKKKEFQNYVSGYVEIYLAKDKNDRKSYEFLGIFPVKAGKFSASVKVNKTGIYHVIAHYTGSFMFYSSWSDPVVEILGKPYIETNIGSKVCAGVCEIKGKVVYGKPVKGTIYLFVDGRKYEEKFNTTFSFKVYLNPGNHTIRIYYPGSKTQFISPVEWEREVEAGYVRVYFSNLTAIAGKYWTSNVTVYFNNRPINEVVEIGYPFYVSVRKFVKAKCPEVEGIYAVNYSVPSIGYENVAKIYVKSPTKVEASFNGDYLVIRVLDLRGKLVKGVVYVNGMKYYSNGILRLKFKENEATIYYVGDKTHIPSKAKVEKPLPAWIYLLPLPFLALLALKLRKERTLVFEYEPPPIWLPGDRISVKAKGKGIIRISVDGKRIGFDKGEYSFAGELGEGEHEVLAEVLNEKGKVVEKDKIKIYVLPFRRAIAKVFEEVLNFCRKKGMDVENMTAREVLEKLNVDEELKRKILSFFEPKRYGEKSEGSRKDLVEFYELCKELIRRCSS